MSTDLYAIAPVPAGAWVPIAQASTRSGVSPSAIRRAVGEGRVPSRSETVGRRSRILVPLDDVIAVLGAPASSIDEALERADEALSRAERAEELARFLRDEVSGLYLANVELRQEVAGLSRDLFQLRVGGACETTTTGARTRRWRRRAPRTA